MEIGHKIKELRNKAGLTQKDLADKLFVTFQAVSRWENNDAEPSLDTLKKICEILNCSTDDLFGIEKSSEERQSIVEKVIVQEHKPVLGVCEQCNKPIYDASDLKRVERSIVVKTGKTKHTESRPGILCGECDELRLLQEKKDEEDRKKLYKSSLKKKRTRSFVWASLCASLFIFLGIIATASNFALIGGWLLVFSIFVYCFVGTLVLNNTFIPDMWLSMCSFASVRFPGIIFGFSVSGFLFLISMKILFYFLRVSLILLATIIFTLIALPMSIFVYPLALSKNLRGIE